jgi:two-component system nitrogen regulation response regulator NtrX
MKRQRVLVVDDEPGIRGSLSGVLEDEGYEVETVGDGESCLARLAERPFDAVLLDVWLPGIDGMETLVRIQEIPQADRPMVVMISGHGTIETAVRATKLGAYDFIEKPLTIDKVSVLLKNACQQRRLEREIDRLKEGDGKLRIIGESVPMKALRQQLGLMAGTNGRVLDLVKAEPAKNWLRTRSIRTAHGLAKRLLR